MITKDIDNTQKATETSKRNHQPYNGDHLTRGLLKTRNFNLPKEEQTVLLQVKSANCNCYKYSFFVTIIREWNDLPANVVEVGNLRRFKIALKS